MKKLFYSFVILSVVLLALFTVGQLSTAQNKSEADTEASCCYCNSELKTNRNLLHHFSNLRVSNSMKKLIKPSEKKNGSLSN